MTNETRGALAVLGRIAMTLNNHGHHPDNDDACDLANDIAELIAAAKKIKRYYESKGLPYTDDFGNFVDAIAKAEGRS